MELLPRDILGAIDDGITRADSEYFVTSFHVEYITYNITTTYTVQVSYHHTHYYSTKYICHVLVLKETLKCSLQNSIKC